MTNGLMEIKQLYFNNLDIEN